MNAERHVVGAIVVGAPSLVGAILLVAGAALGALPVVQAPPENPITEAKRVLGKALFWDEQLSIDNTVSCGSCHMAGAAGSDFRIGIHPGADGVSPSPDDVFGSPGVIASDDVAEYEPAAFFELDVQATGRSAQPSIMSMYAPELFWDGRATDHFVDPESGQTLIVTGGALESQALGPILSEVEMGHADRDWDEVVKKLEDSAPLALAENIPADVVGAISGVGSYRDLFESAFGDSEITPARIAYAIATYERTLVPDETPFDAFVAGDINAMTPNQQAGFQAFMNSNCAACHTGDQFTDHSFRNIAVRPANQDPGRFEVTGNNADRGRFKVPTLRNVGVKPTFMHTGEFTTLPQVMAFYRGPGAPGNNRDPLLPVAFPPPVEAQVIDFMQNALSDPRVANETFPFDRPTLRTELSDGRPVVVAPGRAAANGMVPEVIARSPNNVGFSAFKLGLENAPSDAAAELVLSSNAPIGGELTGVIAYATTTDLEGVATGWWPIPANSDFEGESVYFQWHVDDPGTTGGAALSEVVRLDLYCGGLCPDVCLADRVAPEGVIDLSDVDAFISAFVSVDAQTSLTADIAPPAGVVDLADIDAFIGSFLSGCP
ncbi:MAG: cytochrome c peroxidase [Planctomycetota bacterium]